MSAAGGAPERPHRPARALATRLAATRWYRQSVDRLLAVFGRVNALTAEPGSAWAWRGRRQWLSLPLATAVVAGIAAALLLVDALPDEIRQGALLSGKTLENDALEGGEVRARPAAAALSADPPRLAAAPPLDLAEPIPEPAAGPDMPDTGAPETGAEQRRPAGRRALPEVPDVPAELDDIARELQRRRAEVLELEAGLALREAAVRAAETDLKAQVDRLEAFKRDLEALVGEAEAEEEERLQQLVRMYESMRAKSAAAIFDRLELPVILAVAKRMREARMAAILAAMDPARARVVTSELAQERSLPRLE